MEILSIIPARGGSKGIVKKNIKMLNGIPLIAHTINASKKSKYINRTILSTEDEQIKTIAKEYKSEIHNRPENLALDETKTAPVLLDVVYKLEKENYYPQYVVLLQPTCPLRTSCDIDNAFEILLNNKEKYDSVFSAYLIGNTHSKWKKLHNGNLEALYDYRNRPRRQDTNLHYDLYTETGSIYIIKTEVMKEVKDFIGKRPGIFIENTICDIDTQEDFLIAQEILNKRIKSSNL